VAITGVGVICQALAVAGIVAGCATFVACILALKIAAAAIAACAATVLILLWVINRHLDRQINQCHENNLDCFVVCYREQGIKQI